MSGEGASEWQKEKEALTGEIKSLSTKLETALTDLSALKAKPHADPEALTAATEAISTLRTEIKEAREELAALKSPPKAPEPEKNSPPPAPPPPQKSADVPPAPEKEKPPARKNQRGWI